MASTVSAWLNLRLPTIRYISVSMMTWPLLLGAVWWLMPAAAPLEAPVDRFLLAVQWCAAPGAVILVMVLGCMRLLDTTKAEDPFAGAESRRFQINQRVIQNTLEQMAFFLPALLALSVRLDPAHTRALPVLVVTWCISRVVFWIGYQIHPDHRSLGFSWTQNTAMLALGWLVVTLL